MIKNDTERILMRDTGTDKDKKEKKEKDKDDKEPELSPKNFIHG
ncbi:MAG: hypothetical protein ACM3TR_08920 [Caulobacteraceae bacterium]